MVVVVLAAAAIAAATAEAPTAAFYSTNIRQLCGIVILTMNIISFGKLFNTINSYRHLKDRQTDRQTDRHTYIHTYIHTDRHVYI